MGKSSKLWIGLLMLAAGCLRLFGSLRVTSGFFGRLHIGNFSFGNGILLIPFVIGLVLLFLAPKKSHLSLGLMIAAILFLFLFVMAEANVRLISMSLSSWLILLVLIFGGLGLILSSIRDGIEEKRATREEGRQRRRNGKRTEGPTAGLEKKEIASGQTGIDRELEELKRKL